MKFKTAFPDTNRMLLTAAAEQRENRCTVISRHVSHAGDLRPNDNG